jgi:hypothetical protein
VHTPGNPITTPRKHTREGRYGPESALLMVILGAIGLPLSPLALPVFSSSLSPPISNNSSRSSHTSLRLLWVGFVTLGLELPGRELVGM